MDPAVIFEKIVDVIESLENLGIPSWVLNLLVRILMAVIPKMYSVLKRETHAEVHDEKTS